MEIEDRPDSRPTARTLGLTFLGVALSGFGGVLPFARRALVERRRWLTEADFNETLALCQSLPGPNIVNLSVVVGSRFAGVRGACAGVAGLLAAPVILVLCLATLWARFGASGRIPAAIDGLGAAAAGLVAATALKMARPILARAPAGGGAIIAFVFVAVAVARAPLIAVLAVAAPVSVLSAWRRRPGGRG